MDLQRGDLRQGAILFRNGIHVLRRPIALNERVDRHLLLEEFRYAE